jgi:hypothetical protein
VAQPFATAAVVQVPLWLKTANHHLKITIIQQRGHQEEDGLFVFPEFNIFVVPSFNHYLPKS